MTPNEYTRVSFRVIKMFYNYGDGFTTLNILETKEFAYFKGVNCMVCEL